MQTETVLDTDTANGLATPTIDSKFFDIEDANSSVTYSRLLEKIKFRELALGPEADLQKTERAMRFSETGIQAAWIDPANNPKLRIVPCKEEGALHIGPVEASPWAVTISNFRKESLRELKKIFPHQREEELICKMQVEVVAVAHKKLFIRVIV